MTALLRVPAAEELLEAWEHGLAAAPARAELLLSALGVADSSALPLGQRNRLLLQARMLLFGAVADVVASCQGCGEQLEAELAVPCLVGDLPDYAVNPGVVRSREYVVRLRLLTSADLTGLPDDVDTAAGELLARCVVEARHGEAAVESGQLPADVVEAADDALAAADPGAVLALNIVCPVCEGGATHAVDPVRLLWSEVDAWAWRLLAEVHLLAATHGWAEADVLRMTPTRRQSYLHLCGGAGQGIV